ncbi:IstB-like ATP binding protein [Desulforamulus putei DSM 12395]|uniref:IstB-like ATP binding protein n=1 Tax=Desulforamulus putei DSM 12395 TaxID=1121429 RepID=A0A1M4WBZ8_9FIRM|nr:IstB-like ATP binding protein [Desulforamulus putei DSM 12395]
MTAREEHRLLKLEKEWMRDELVILDELGYIPFSKTGAELLFQFCSTRHELGSIIVTTNLDFEKWTGLFFLLASIESHLVLPPSYKTRIKLFSMQTLYNKSLT